MCIFHEYLCSLFVLLLTRRRQCIMGRRRILGAREVHRRARRDVSNNRKDYYVRIVYGLRNGYLRALYQFCNEESRINTKYTQTV